MRKTRILSLLLAAALLLSVGTPAAAGAEETEDARMALPAVGETVEGFELKEVRDFALAGGELAYFEHGKTGAKLLYIRNEDPNRAFQLTFETRPENDEGLPHVFEHATLSGSEKYPSTSLFMNALYQTYNTYMNAYTTDIMTCFPLASLSEKQLLALADLYTDCCLHPLIMERESIYRTEAWRYEMTDEDADLTYNGTVYSEMTGSLTLERTALLNANKATFPGAFISYEYGGVPDVIPEMTWEELKDFHNRNYHPSNCIAMLYGGFSDYSAFLRLLDRAFSDFERTEISWEDDGYVPLTEPVTARVPYPVAAGTDTANRSTVCYYILCPGLKGDREAEEVLDHAAQVLGDSSSPLMQRLKKAFPAATFGVGREVAAPVDAVVFLASGVGENDGERLVQVVQESLKEVAENGFDSELVDVIVNQLQMSSKLVMENDPVTSLMHSVAYTTVNTGDPFSYVESAEALNLIEEENRQGLLQESVRKWLTDPEIYTVTTTYPAPGEKEVHDAELADRLAKIKAEMTPEQRAAIIAETQAPDPVEENAELLAILRQEEVSTLPEEVRQYRLTDTVGEDGIRYITAEAGTDGVGEPMLFLDAAAMPEEDLHYMNLYARALGEVPTDAHSREELQRLMNRYMTGGSASVGLYGWERQDHPYLCLSWIAQDPDLEQGYALAEEMLYRSDFTDVERLKEFVQAQKNSVRSQINQAPFQLLLFRQMAVDKESYRYRSWLSGVDYYAFLEETEKKLEEGPEEVTKRLEGIRDFFFNRAGAASGYAGPESGIALNTGLAGAFFAKLPETAREPAVYHLPVPARREALVIDANIQYNCLAASFDSLGIPNDYALQAVSSLIADQLLLPQLRDKMGAYGAYCNVLGTKEGIGLFSYRDPNVADTFRVYQNAADQLEALEVDQETLDGYILSAYSGLARESGELTGAANAVTNRMSDVPDDLKLQVMRRLKTVTPADVKAAVPLLRALAEKGNPGTAGGIAAIGANTELYDAVLNPFHTEAAASGAPDDVPEDHPASAAVKFVLENRLMTALEGNLFGVDENATAGDLAEAIFVGAAGGAPGDPAEALEALTAYGVFPAGLEAGEPLTWGLRDRIISQFAAAISAEIPAAATEENRDTPMTRGELAEDLLSLLSNPQ